jgi:glutathione S-transferase
LLLAEHMGATFSDFPHIKQYVDRVKGRKAVAKALQLHTEAGMPQKDLFGGAI